LRFGYLGMSAFQQGPFYSHTLGYAPAQMAEAHDALETTMAEQGPFDGVLGFSQGGALAISYMHKKQAEGKYPPPFAFALIMSSVMPCSANPRDCEALLSRLAAKTGGVSIADLTDQEVSKLEADEKRFVELLDRTIIPARSGGGLLPDIDVGRVYSSTEGEVLAEAPRLMHPDLLMSKNKIKIPMVHITGRRDFDFMRNMSEAARALCEPRMIKVLEHAGGHQPPQKPAEVKATLRALDWAIGLSQRSGMHI